MTAAMKAGKRGIGKRADTFELYALMSQANQYPDRIGLGRGDPDSDTPPHIVQAVKEAVETGESYDNPPEGIRPLREAIASRVKRVNNIDVDPETEVVVTNGGQQAIYLMSRATLEAGDSILSPEPNYNTYRDAFDLIGAVKVRVPTYVEEDFRTDPDRVQAAMTAQTKAMLLANPNNPTGAVISPEDVRRLGEIAVENDLIILADDIYDRFLYDDHQHLSPGSVPGLRERTLTLNAVSKQYAMCGWRVGWITGPEPLMRKVRAFKSALAGNTSVVSQMGALAALNGPDDCILEMLAEYTKRRDIVMKRLDRLGWSYGKPQGGQFLYADISHMGMSSLDFARWIVEQTHVLFYPGSAFDETYDAFVRITFLQSQEQLTEAFDRVEKLMRELPSDQRG